MTEETMVEALNDGILEIPHYYCKDKTMRETAEDIKEMAVIAMKKQIPKKPMYEYEQIKKHMDDGVKAPYCPVCGEDLLDDYNDAFNYCPSCGQKLDWSD